MAILGNPDLTYEKTREQLLPYEDARYNSLMADMPDCYSGFNDSELWATITRSMAQELARMEYFLSYDLVGLQPQYLTPADIRRRWSAPLFINSSFPQPDQFDIDYRNLLVDLLNAYPQGSTLDTIEAVIQAYTGQSIVVQELYKLIGKGVYDDTYRNTLLLNIPAIGNSPLTQVVSADRLATLSLDLYGAIDVAKPAHIGLEYSITFNSGEDVATLIQSFTDTLEIVFNIVESDGLEPEYTLSPYTKPTSPYTTLTGYGQNVGQSFSRNIPYNTWVALPLQFQGEYLLGPDGGYFLNPICYQDTALTDTDGNLTGMISKAKGVLAPRMNDSWMIKRDTLLIYRID